MRDLDPGTVFRKSPHQRPETQHYTPHRRGWRTSSAPGRVERFALNLATKPHDRFFLCHIPTRNLDNAWNATALQACEDAKLRWIEAISRRDEGVDGYLIWPAQDQTHAFPDPTWPAQSMDELVEKAFSGCMIDAANHPALLRLIGAAILCSVPRGHIPERRRLRL